METQEKEAVRKFMREFEMVITGIETSIGYLKLSDERTVLKDKALKILKSKFKEARKASGAKELKKIIKLNKVFEKYEI